MIARGASRLLFPRIVLPLLAAVLVVALVLAGAAGYRLLRADIESRVYRERLAALDADYQHLRRTYDEAVRRTAVTELLVRDGVLHVSVRSAAGVLETIPTPFDPTKEIYVDYVVWQGRLWIRRVFDEDTAPGDALVIDPALASVDWQDPGLAHGKAAYRPLAEGRWIVSVTGDGSLGLAPAVEGAAHDLAPPPPVREYEPVSEEVSDSLRGLSPPEILRAASDALRGRD